MDEVGARTYEMSAVAEQMSSSAVDLASPFRLLSVPPRWC